MRWESAKFGQWLKMQRRVIQPMSQEKLASRLDVTQSKVSRWEQNYPGTEPPTLDQCRLLSAIFDVDFIELAKLCGQWSEELQRAVLVNLAAGIDVNQSPEAQLVLAKAGIFEDLGPTAYPALFDVA